MKLRIKGNSIRLRLLRSEVERFAATGRISEEMRFGPDGSPVLKYSLLSSPAARSISSQLAGDEITVSVPHVEAISWATGDTVGMTSKQDIGNGNVLEIIIEKDFACLDRIDDPDREDAFPNPTSVC